MTAATLVTCALFLTNKALCKTHDQGLVCTYHAFPQNAYSVFAGWNSDGELATINLA